MKKTTQVDPDNLPEAYQHIIGNTGEGKVVHLTFDDGPGEYTGQVLDILKDKGVKATFCQIGNQIADHEDLMRRIVAEGHQLCNHSWDHHAGYGEQTAAQATADIAKTQQAFIDATGTAPGWFRAPGGAFTDTVRAGAATNGTHLLGWMSDSEDWKEPGVKAIVDNVIKDVTPGVIILMHDGGGDRTQTVKSLPLIIDKLHALGYDIVAVPGRTPTPGR